jgi:hypothetical protein
LLKSFYLSLKHFGLSLACSGSPIGDVPFLNRVKIFFDAPLFPFFLGFNRPFSGPSSWYSLLT